MVREQKNSCDSRQVRSACLLILLTWLRYEAPFQFNTTGWLRSVLLRGCLFILSQSHLSLPTCYFRLWRAWFVQKIFIFLQWNVSRGCLLRLRSRPVSHSLTDNRKWVNHLSHNFCFRKICPLPQKIRSWWQQFLIIQVSFTPFFPQCTRPNEEQRWEYYISYQLVLTRPLLNSSHS